MKKIMAVYDEDPFYAERLSDYVNRKEKKNYLLKLEQDKSEF